MFLNCIFLFLYSCSLVFLWWEDSSSFSYTSFFYQYIPLSFPIKKKLRGEISSVWKEFVPCMMNLKCEEKS